MIVRVAVEGIESTLDLDSAWTPELLGTLLRLCGDEVIRVCESLGVKTGSDAESEELFGADGDDVDDAGES